MKEASKKILVILALFCVTDRAIGVLLDYLRDHSPDGRYYKTNYSLSQCSEDVIIVGSSRGEINLVSQVVEDSLKMRCWNTGRGGQGIPYFRAIEEAILARYVPKLVIINVDDDILENSPSYDRVGFLRPYYHDHPVIRPILDKTTRLEGILEWSRLYAYNSSYYYLIRPYFLHNLDGKISDKGWKPRLNKMSVDIAAAPVTASEYGALHPESVAEFDLLVQKFLERGARVVMVVSPNYGRRVADSPTILHVQELSQKFGIPLHLYSADTAFTAKAEYFVDPEHLNTDGAHFLTNDLAHKIKTELPVKTAGASATHETISKTH